MSAVKRRVHDQGPIEKYRIPERRVDNRPRAICYYERIKLASWSFLPASHAFPSREAGAQLHLRSTAPDALGAGPMAQVPHVCSLRNPVVRGFHGIPLGLAGFTVTVRCSPADHSAGRPRGPLNWASQLRFSLRPQTFCYPPESGGPGHFCLALAVCHPARSESIFTRSLRAPGAKALILSRVPHAILSTEPLTWVPSVFPG